MRLALVTMLADDAGEVQVARTQPQAGFLPRLATGASVRRLTHIGAELPAARTPEAPVGRLRPLQQQDFVAFVEAVEQRGDFVGQRHAGSEAGIWSRHKPAQRVKASTKVGQRFPPVQTP